MANIFLRALSMGDLELTSKWHSDEELYKSLVGPFRYVSQDAEKEWLESKVKYSNQEINLMICLKENSQPIGMISVRDIDWISRTGHFTGLLIGKSEFQGKGYGSEALQLLLQHVFQDLGLNRIWGFALESNLSSLRMLEKCGFMVEGKLKQHSYKNGHFIDVSVVGLCANDYFAKQQNIK
ncbi:MAG TPA: hypothetical protein DCY35_10295 [Prolixibacteraceae bacterium]|nr:hypothetical protein [Prolixibacteraceae bacterium]